VFSIEKHFSCAYNAEYHTGGIAMEAEPFSRKISFLKPGWWFIHLIGIALVYAIGHLIWR